MVTSAHQPAPQLPAQTRAFRPDVRAEQIANGPVQPIASNWQQSGNDLLPLTVTDLNRTDLSGLSLGPWRPGSKLGQGGMGQVFLATHETLGRSFAIKFLTAGLTSSQEASQRFQDEIRSVGQMQHANIVSAVDAGVKNGIHYLVTDYVAGQTLSEVVANEGPLPEARVIEIARQIAAGLAHAHRLGFVHRDIKPSNLMLDEAGTIRILDFGIARHTNGSSSLTADGQLLGTAEFLAPEQAADAQSVDGRGDLYSLGGTLLFLLTGETPFPKSTHPTFASQIHAHLFETPPAIAQPRSEWSPQLLSLLTRLMARNPNDRFSSAQDVVSFLEGKTSASPTRKLNTVRLVTFGTLACAFMIFAMIRQIGGSKGVENPVSQASPLAAVRSADVNPLDANQEQAVSPEAASTAEATKPASSEKGPEPEESEPALQPSSANTSETEASESPEPPEVQTDLQTDVQTVNTSSSRNAGHAPAPFPRKHLSGNTKQRPGIRSGAPQ